MWLARNVTGSLVAVKVVARSAFDHDRPFEREFEGIKRFEPISRSDPSQLAILHVGRGEGFFYYVMELADAVESPKSEPASNGFGVRSSSLVRPLALGVWINTFCSAVEMRGFSRHVSCTETPLKFLLKKAPQDPSIFGKEMRRVSHEFSGTETPLRCGAQNRRSPRRQTPSDFGRNRPEIPTSQVELEKLGSILHFVWGHVVSVVVLHFSGSESLVKTGTCRV